MDKNQLEHLAALYGSGTDPRPKDVHIACPFAALYHRDGIDRQLALSVKISPGQTSVAFCFSCGAQGPVLVVFERACANDPHFKVATEFIREHDGASLSVALANMKLQRRQVEVPTDDWSVYAARCSRQVPTYLVNRGIVQTDVTKWSLGYDPDLMRAIFPVRDEHGSVVGCLRRAVMSDQKPPYKDTPGAAFWKPNTFYGEHLIDKTLGIARLVEGPMDTIKGERTLPNVLGVMGASTGVAGERLEKLHRWGIHTLIFLFDPDKAGRTAVQGKWNAHGKWIDGLRTKLRGDFVVKRGILPDGLDPDTCSPEQLRKADREARYLEPKRPLTGRATRDNLLSDPQNGSFKVYEYFKQKPKQSKD